MLLAISILSEVLHLYMLSVIIWGDKNSWDTKNQAWPVSFIFVKKAAIHKTRKQYFRSSNDFKLISFKNIQDNFIPLELVLSHFCLSLKIVLMFARWDVNGISCWTITLGCLECLDFPKLWIATKYICLECSVYVCVNQIYLWEEKRTKDINHRSGSVTLFSLEHRLLIKWLD